MKWRAFISHLSKNNCASLKEGGNHSWWRNRTTNRRSAVPRHSEVNDLLVKKICKDLGIDNP